MSQIDLLPAAGSDRPFINIAGDATVYFPAGGDVGVAADYNSYTSYGSSDIYNYRAANGNVWIRDTSGTGDVLNLGDIPSIGVAVSRAYNRDNNTTYDLVLTIAATGKTITIDNYYFAGFSGPDIINFSDGVTLTHAQLATIANNNSAVSPAIFRLSAQLESIDLRTPYGYPVVAEIYADGGNGHVTTNVGSDTFHYARADGNLTISDTGKGSDRLDLEDLGAGDVTVGKSPDNIGDVLVTVDSTGHRILLERQLADATSGIGRIAFADGTVWTRDQINALATAGTSGSDSMTGTSGSDLLDGRGGNDTAAGAGGNDTYFYRRGYGSLAIDNSAHNRSGAGGELDFGQSFDPQHLWFSQNGTDLVITPLGASSRVTVARYFGNDPTAALAEITTPGGSKLDAETAQLVSAMATYASENAGFDPSLAAHMPVDQNLQRALAAAWHG